MIRKSFGRSLSFPIPTVPKIKGLGSTSLPCRFHPFISDLDDEIRDLLTWQLSQARSDPSAWILDGLAKLDRLHSSVDDLLQHPQAHDQLRRRSAWTGRVLNDFLRFADAYGSLRSAIFALKDRQSATESAIRRKDDPRIASCAREQRRAVKELIRISAAVKSAGRWVPAAAVPDCDAAEAELAAVMREVAVLTATASAAVMTGIAEMSACGVTSLVGSCMVGPVIVRLGSLRKKGGEDKWRADALQRLEALEDFVGMVEKRCEKLFRSLVNTRVFLLNILTPCL